MEESNVIYLEVNGEEREFTVFYEAVNLNGKLISPICHECGSEMDFEPTGVFVIDRIIDTTDTTDISFGEEEVILSGELHEQVIKAFDESTVFDQIHSDVNICESCSQRKSAIGNAIEAEEVTCYEPQHKI